MRANCSLTKLILTALKNKGECDRSIFAERLIQQEYVNALDCEEKIDEICFHEPICDNTQTFPCNLLITSIVVVKLTEDEIHIKANTNSSDTGAQYAWVFPDDRVALISGHTANEEILKLNWLTTDKSFFEISLTIQDSNGCVAKTTTDVIPCPDCASVDFNVSISNNSCWELVDGKYRMPLDVSLDCQINPNFIDQLQSVNIITTNITTVKYGDKWYLEVDNYDTYKNIFCKTVPANCINYIVDTKSIYSINIATGATLSLAVLEVGTSELVDIAHTENFIFTAVEDSVTFDTIIKKYPVVHSPFSIGTPTTQALNSFVNPYGLFAIDDNRLIISNNVSGTHDEIREYDVLTNTSIVKITLPVGMFVDGDILLIDDDLYIITTNTINSFIRRYKYSTGTFIDTNTLSSTRALGIFRSNNQVYICYDTGGISTVSYSPFSESPPSILTGVLVNGASQSSLCANTYHNEIEFTATYEYCFLENTRVYTINPPCIQRKCCEECDIDFDFSFGSCYRDLSAGIERYEVDLDIITTGCTTFDLNNFSVTSGAPNNYAMVYYDDVRDKYVLVTRVNSYTSFSYSYTYISCGVTKNVTGTFGTPTSIPKCCVVCSEAIEFFTNIPTQNCIESIDNYWRVKANFNFFCPINQGLVPYDGVRVIYNGVHIGEVYEENIGEWYLSINDSYNYEDICGETLLLEIITKECGDTVTYNLNITIPCGFLPCETCVDCADPADAVYNLSISDLCFSYNPENLKNEAVLPSLIECNGKFIKIASFTVSYAGTGCVFSIVKRNGVNYLSYSGACASLNGNLSITYCWESC